MEGKREGPRESRDDSDGHSFLPNQRPSGEQQHQGERKKKITRAGKGSQKREEVVQQNRHQEENERISLLP